MRSRTVIVRSPVQGALAWIWGRSGQTIPIPGIKTAAQAEENLGASESPPLTADEVARARRLYARDFGL